MRKYVAIWVVLQMIIFGLVISWDHGMISNLKFWIALSIFLLFFLSLTAGLIMSSVKERGLVVTGEAWAALAIFLFFIGFIFPSMGSMGILGIHKGSAIALALAYIFLGIVFGAMGGIMKSRAIKAELEG